MVASIGGAVTHVSLVDSRQAGGRTDAEFAWLMRIVGIAGSCDRAVGLGLLIAAIFVGDVRGPKVARSTPRGGGK